MTTSIDTLRNTLATLLTARDAKGSSVLGAGSDDLESGRRWLSAALPEGLAVPDWPVEYGGRGANGDESAEIVALLAEFAVPDMYPYAVGLSLVGPVLLDQGTDEQRDRWLRPIADGSEIWCQMFSEPDAGSDMANIATRAVRDGDEWMLNGQKVWTSRGKYSKWGMCLARTDPDQVKHRGLTMFAVDMEAPGVEVRPLHQMNGDTHFSEVFTTDVRVPDANRIGEEGKGWGIAMAVLTHERESMGGSGGGLDPSGGYAWLDQFRELPVAADPVWRDRAMKVYIEQRAAAMTASRISEGSGGKLRLVKVYKDRTNLMKDALGPAGMLTGIGHIEFLTAPSMSIRGGTDEIQRNIVGERVLGLPPEPRPDKAASYAQLRRDGLV